jgi:hypothetical protein
VNNILDKNPELVIGLGDYSYNNTGDCWFNITAPLQDRMKIAIGDHEDPSKVCLCRQALSWIWYQWLDECPLVICQIRGSTTFCSAEPSFRAL